MKIGIVVGEASGDILGAALMTALKKIYPQCEFEGIGGERMIELGFTSFFPQDRLAVMGLIDPLKRLPELLSMRRYLKKYFSSHPPTVFIGIDSPDFNLDLELFLRQKGIKTAHYVSPSVWAWRQGRIKKIAKAIDLMITLFPFEERFYQQHKVPVVCVGHTLADDIPMNSDAVEARKALDISLDATYVGILPGSRAGEVSHLCPIFLETARVCVKQRPDLRFIIPAANKERKQQIEKLLLEFPGLPVTLFLGRSREVMAASDSLLIASGTSTLEAMLIKRPMVIAYRAAALTYALISPFVKVKFIGLPNLLADTLLVPEFRQNDVVASTLAPPLLDFLSNPIKVESIKLAFTRLHHDLQRNASDIVAKRISSLIGDHDE